MPALPHILFGPLLQFAFIIRFLFRLVQEIYNFFQIVIFQNLFLSPAKAGS